ncbi:hypothetical protein Droror1_Dr00019076 [Drosera rotundifolia]
MLFIAGTDTSSCTIEWAMTEMLKNQTIFARLQTEIDDVIGKNRQLEESDISKLSFLQTVCKETFRKYPMVPLNIPRVTNEPCQVNGYYIPKNARLFVNVWAMGRDHELWENPPVFDPNRFMSKKTRMIEPWGNDFELTRMYDIKTKESIQLRSLPVTFLFSFPCRQRRWSVHLAFVYADYIEQKKKEKLKKMYQSQITLQRKLPKVNKVLTAQLLENQEAVNEK